MRKIVLLGLVGGLMGRMMAEATVKGVIQTYAIESAVARHPSRVDGKPRGKGKTTKDWQR